MSNAESPHPDWLLTLGKALRLWLRGGWAVAGALLLALTLVGVVPWTQALTLAVVGGLLTLASPGIYGLIGGLAEGHRRRRGR